MSNANPVVNSVFLKASSKGTGVDGLHRAGSFLDHGAHWAKQGLFSLPEQANLSFALDGQNFSISSDILFQAWLELPLSLTGDNDGKLKNAIERAKLLEAGYITKTQKEFVSDGSSKPQTTAPVKYVLTADEYRQNCIKLAQIDVVVLYDRLSKVTSTTNKTELFELVMGLKDSIFNAEQRGTYEMMLEKEKALEPVKAMGFEKIQKSITGSTEIYIAEIPAATWPKVMAQFDDGFVRKSIIVMEKDAYEFPTRFRVTFGLKPMAAKTQPDQAEGEQTTDQDNQSA